MGVAAIGPCDKDISNIISMPLHKEVPHKNVQIGNGQEMAQSERNSHSTKFQVDRHYITFYIIIQVSDF